MSSMKISDLKAKFVAGAIPLEEDYAHLLDMLEETRIATGTSPDAPAGLAIPMTTRLRIACGIFDGQRAYYGVTNGIYAVAIQRAGYIIVHYFQPSNQITARNHLTYGSNQDPLYCTYEVKFGTAGQGMQGINVLTAIFSGQVKEGDTLSVLGDVVNYRLEPASGVIDTIDHFSVSSVPDTRPGIAVIKLGVLP